MAVLRLEDGTTYTELSDIAQELAPLKIQLNHWSVGDNPEIHRLLEQDTLSDIEKEKVLKALDSYFEQLKQTAGYQSRDLIVLYPDIPNLDKLLSKGNKIRYSSPPSSKVGMDSETITCNSKGFRL